MQIGCTCASLHVKDFHFVVGVILKDILLHTVFVISEIPVKISLNLRIGCVGILCTVRFFKQCFQVRSFYSRIIVSVSAAQQDFACLEVDRAAQGIVDTAQVDHKDIINVQPEIIIACELKNHIVSPGILTADRLCEACFQLHTEEIIGISVFSIQRILFVGNGVQWFTAPRVIVWKRNAKCIGLVLNL